MESFTDLPGDMGLSMKKRAHGVDGGGFRSVLRTYFGFGLGISIIVQVG